MVLQLLFFNKNLKRILYFTCIAQSKFSAGIEDEEEGGDDEDLAEARRDDAEQSGSGGRVGVADDVDMLIPDIDL